MRFFLGSAVRVLMAQFIIQFTIQFSVQFEAHSQNTNIQEVNGKQTQPNMQLQPPGAPETKFPPSRPMKKNPVPALQNSPAGTSPLKGPAQSGLGANVFGDESIRRDPFRLPQYLINKLTYRPPAPIAAVDQQAIDDRIEPIRRWNTKEYTLVGIIWEVKNPKALLRDVQSRVHVIRINDKVGNQEGVVTSIREGAITVSERDDPVVLRLKK